VGGADNPPPVITNYDGREQLLVFFRAESGGGAARENLPIA
jgi:hypothetical protein